MRHGDGLAAERQGHAFCKVEVVQWLFSADIAVNRRVVHKATKHISMVGSVRSSYRGRVKDASDELDVRLALLGRAVGLGGCNAELADSA
eukprot:2791019-Pleurochrysis_carterae.AAC.1